MLRVGEDQVCSVPRHWTDVVASDPEIVIGEGRALLRVVDLLELADLVARLRRESLEGGGSQCKANSAALVSVNTPRKARGERTVAET